MKALVTGGAGFIGSNLALELQAQNWDVKILDDFSHGSRDNITDFRGETFISDIYHVDQVVNSWPADIIFHQAAITDTTISSEKIMRHVNVDGFTRVLDYALKTQAKVVFASSAATYGDGSLPMSESQTPAPLNVYGQSKVDMERLALEYNEKYGLPLIGLRYFNVYGPREEHKRSSASMIWQLAAQMAGGVPPRIFKWGAQKRDQIYIKDILRANLLAAQCNISGVYNVGTGNPVSFNEVIHTLREIFGCGLETEYFDNPYDFYQDRTQAEISLSARILKFQSEYDIKKGISSYFEEVDITKFVSEDPQRHSSLF